ncbi:LPS-assembly protein LptD [Ferruginibacter lapsinanis]|uniref:putative LPS assembly protein LptD n=1 Tax=Ferruginibacter lapsinanis TaxID=563172 RepID=UPI001E42B028|nr:putative LPS assembly protein LptD [Ferruginibacter lapsinanis]UEG49580.1 LPS-assembly protein LptD [Ferruginibacter lapsinanis]
MNNNYKGKAKYISASLAVLLLSAMTLISSGSNSSLLHFYKILTPIKGAAHDNENGNIVNSIHEMKKYIIDTIPGDDTLIIQTKVDTLNVKASKDSLDAPVVYHADDSMVLDVPGKKIYLYGKDARTKYKDNELTAPGIEFDQSTNLVTASLKKDSLGKVIAFPTFNQSDFKSVSDTIEFNMKTGKGLTKGTYTQQGEMYVYGEKIKKVDDKVFYAKNGRFTTCNLDTPHFAFVSRKIKFINKKMAITGPVHPEFEGIPLPIYLPFGIYPLSQGRHSGLLAPTFTANDQLGLALEGLGYYKVLSDNWDITTRGTLYSYGGWTASVSPRYFKRYHYQGSFNIDYQKFKYNFKGDPDYSSSKTFNFRWGHSVDSKARPGVSFSANVNAGSSKFNSLVPNSPMRNFSNRLYSTIQYAKVWKDKPYNISINANHNQNTVDRIINVTLPEVSFNLNTQYPFRRKEAAGTLKWYENIGLALNSNAKSLTYFSDDKTVSPLPIFNQITNNLQWGANHNIPISLSLPQLGPLQIMPSVSYTERWYQKKFIRSWNAVDNKVDTNITRGFFAAREMSYGVGVSTRIFGLFGFKKGSKIQAIRHEIRPTISFNYKPDMNRRSYYNTQIDETGREARFSVYEGSLFGAFGEGKFGGISFGLDNNIQMKVRNKRDTAQDASKKITLIDGLSLSGGYNFLIDSFQLSLLSVSARTNLFDKLNITANATLDPYDVDAKGERIKQLIWKRKWATLGRLMGGNVSMSSRFQGGSKKDNKNTNQQQPLTGQPYNPATGMPLDEYQTEAAYINSNPAEFADFSIPWSINLSYSLRFTRERKADYSGFQTNFYQDVNWNGTLGLSPRWQIGMNGFYNITQKELGTLSLSLSREMHCWQMGINISPVGRYRFFNISISPKSGILRDLKINRTRYFYDF